MTLLQALFMGLLQGATELFPVSSLGHAVLLPSLLHWSFKQSDSSFLPFLVLLHIGTAIALLILYRAQWVSIIRWRPGPIARTRAARAPPNLSHGPAPGRRRRRQRGAVRRRQTADEADHVAVVPARRRPSTKQKVSRPSQTPPMLS